MKLYHQITGTAIGDTVTVDEITAWYDCLSAPAKENPTGERVKTLSIRENSHGEISGVEYIYRERASAPQPENEIVFMIETEIL